MLAEIKQVEIKHVKIPAADTLGLDSVMAIYQALRPIMPVVGRDGACQTAPRLIDILDEFDGLVLDGYGVINIGDGPIEGTGSFRSSAMMFYPAVMRLVPSLPDRPKRPWPLMKLLVVLGG